ncbi:MAG: calcium-translocating P-type ATPase, PMCA-type [Bacteroidota bacterium]
MKYNYSGLSEEEVRNSRDLNGTNDLAMIKGESFYHKLKENFRNPIIIILNVALVLILLLSFFGQSEWYEALAIAVAVLLAVLVSTLSEFKNESSFQKLQDEASRIICNVFRNGKITEIVINEIVKGDYVLLQSGDKIPADGVLINGELKVNQASLTGESDEITKTATSPDYKLKVNDFNDPHYVFRGSVVDDGEAVILIDTVGDESFYGQLTKELSISSSRLSPLQLKLENLAHMISVFGYIGAGLIALSYMFNKILIENGFDTQLIAQYFHDWQFFTEDILNALVLAIIIIVAAVPEGLPMMIAIVLSLNMRKMLKEKVLVRKLLGIETAGSLDILFSDKTGTITTGKLEPQYILDGKLQKFDTYKEIPDTLKKIVQHSILGNTYCVITPEGEAIGGNISERALINFLDVEDRLIDDEGFKTINTIRFDSAKKFSATEVNGNHRYKELYGSEHVTFVKGAVEINLKNCINYVGEDGQLHELTASEEILKQSDILAEQGVRLIAVGYSHTPISEDKSLPKDINLIGIIGIHDEIREESAEAVHAAQDAGVQAVMITGDRKGTAEAIAKEIGLIEEDDLILTSDELNAKSDEELKEILPHLKVVARALPTDKSRLVRIAKDEGRVVGMTGDGVNDSSALKHADVGFAMGSGSEVAKEAGEIVILDDNFSSITNAIRYGRTIFKSIRKFIIFQLTVNLAAVFTVFLAPFFGIEEPLTIIQLLWINIIMDTMAAIAFGGEPALERVMMEQPIRRNENIVSRYMSSSILTGGLYITLVSILFLTIDPVKELFIRNGVPDEKVFLTAFFNVFIFSIVFNSFNARTEKINLLDNITKNSSFLQIMGMIMALQIIFTYVGGSVLRSTTLQPIEWVYVLGIALTIIPVDIIRKMILKAISGKPLTGV